MVKTLSQKEIDAQLAVGSMDKGDAFVELVKKELTPVPWPTPKEFYKVYPDLKNWMRQVDTKLGEVIKLFNAFFTEDEDSWIHIEFMVNVRFCEDWSAVMVGEDNDKVEAIFRHLQIISPLLVAFHSSVNTPNISTNQDS